MRKIIEQQFSRVDAVTPKAKQPFVAIRIWRHRGRFAASVSCASGGVGGYGDSPEKALGAAVTNYVELERRNA